MLYHSIDGSTEFLRTRLWHQLLSSFCLLITDSERKSVSLWSNVAVGFLVKLHRNTGNMIHFLQLWMRKVTFTDVAVRT